MASSLKKKTVSGIGWSSIENASHFLISFVVSIILARLLSPEEFGLLGLTAIFITISSSLVNGGFYSALIRKQEISEDDYNTAFFVNLSASLLLYVLLFCCAPIISSFFGREELVNLVRIASLGLIIDSFSIVQRARLTKQINFRTQAKITFCSVCIGGIIGVTLAFNGYGVWALVIQNLSIASLRTVLLSIANRWFPHFKYSKDRFGDMFGFGWKIMVSNLLDTLWSEMNQMIVGKFYNAGTLGQYTRAHQFNNLFSGNITNIIQRVTYPVLSSIQNDNDKFMPAYQKIVKATIFITATCLFFVGAVSEPLLYCLIGPKWYVASTYLPLMCITGSIFPLYAVNLNILQVKGRSDFVLSLSIINKVLTVFSFLVGIYIGVIPMLFAYIVVMSTTYICSSYLSGKTIGYGFWLQLKDVAPSYAIGLIIALSVFFIKYLPLSFWYVLPIQIIIGTTVFFLLCEMKKLPEYLELKDIIAPAINKFVVG